MARPQDPNEVRKRFVRFARSDGVWRWSARGKGGMIAFHDLDDHAGENLACRRILRWKGFGSWGYCLISWCFEGSNA